MNQEYFKLTEPARTSRGEADLLASIRLLSALCHARDLGVCFPHGLNLLVTRTARRIDRLAIKLTNPRRSPKEKS